MSRNQTPAERLGSAGAMSKFGGLEPRDFTENGSHAQACGSGRYPHHTPGFKDQGAGRDAAESFTPKLNRRRAEALRIFDALGTATPDEVAALIGRPAHIVRPRVSELHLLGELVKTDERRPSAFGAPQTVYRRATPEERAVFLVRGAAEAEKSGGAA
jgi:hypothetical protein